MKLERSFKDDYNIYFLMEYVSGIELFDAIRDIGKFIVRDCIIYSKDCLLLKKRNFTLVKLC